ncbi:MAG TPA: tRNA 2-thiocytidine biosynthesis TtcA family protein [Clostridiales bacterium]|nr:MAG: tRNA 2-thiocytidine biosynthesis protein TtcA [Firmicutes bacterium ADurb.Bin262]HOU10834.1 tRNA 2-thiocytidine biosynthesis TtcA family protein [Clostridiales bacterium]HQH64182.1 tRNA 2-thiocytidine biosynthesis TtcA family protein [Clostridiales bacterium]HQK72909.1 tRNA 2-thiocytidine biosynthesis TtcA family protein [Clostridiales bacterium]
MHQLAGLVRRAAEQYQMIAAGDRVAVGVSGGKDSVALLASLASLRGYYPQPFELAALIVDPCFDGIESDFSSVEALCALWGIPCVVKRTKLAEVVFETRGEKNPCSLCARMRRGILHDMAKQQGCGKLALGHHLDDAAETFLMNLFDGAALGSFSPVTYLSRKDLTLIRPMIFAREADIARAVRRAGLPVVENRCPVDGRTERERVKRLLDELDAAYPAVREKILHALQKSRICGY